MRRKLLIGSAIIVIAGLIAFYIFNRYFKLLDLSPLYVSTDGNLSHNKVRIKRGFYSINRESDQELFSKDNADWTVYNNIQVGLLKTDYGENDFLITYDDKYYFQYRNFILNSNDQYSYHFFLFKQQDTLYVKADIRGKKVVQFTRPMHLVSEAKLFRCNVPIDSSRVIYNVIELEKP